MELGKWLTFIRYLRKKDDLKLERTCHRRPKTQSSVLTTILSLFFYPTPDGRAFAVTFRVLAGQRTQVGPALSFRQASARRNAKLERPTEFVRRVRLWRSTSERSLTTIQVA
jgi:hypothetical protein